MIQEFDGKKRRGSSSRVSWTNQIQFELAQQPAKYDKILHPVIQSYYAYKMRITNDCSPHELILNLCSPSGVTNEDTHIFFSDKVQSSHDWLIEAWSQKVNAVLECFSRHGHEVTELQGLGDNGVDILMLSAHDDAEARIGFQIKSNNEAKEASKLKVVSPDASITRTMKRQFAEALAHHEVNEWWFIQCFDLNKYKKLVYTNHSELPPGDKNGIRIRHVGPRGAYAFLSRSDDEIRAICTRFLCRDDEILTAALFLKGKLSDLSMFIVNNYFWQTLDYWNQQDTIISTNLIFSSINDFEVESDDARVMESISELETIGFLTNLDGSSFQLNPLVFPELCALYFEGRVRHQLHHHDAVSYASFLLNSEMPDDEDEFAT